MINIPNSFKQLPSSEVQKTTAPVYFVSDIAVRIERGVGMAGYKVSESGESANFYPV